VTGRITVFGETGFIGRHLVLLELLPNPPLTRDQVRLLKTDKVVSGTAPTLGDLGIQPWPLGEFLAVFKDKYS
jgi:hypothetical protein